MPERHDGILSAITKVWLERRTCGLKAKEDFNARAEDSLSYYDGPQKLIYKDGNKLGAMCCSTELAVPSMRVEVNKVFEAVSLLLPMILHRNPTRIVTPRKFRLPDTVRQVLSALGTMPPDSDPLKNAMADARAWLMDVILNATPYEFDLKSHSRKSATEALIKGRGILWTEMMRVGDRYMPAARHVSVDHLILDPDYELVPECNWVMLRRIQPVRDAEDRFGLERGTLRGNFESLPMKYRNDSYAAGSLTHGGGERCTDLIEYWEVYSRVGLGSRMYGASNQFTEMVESFGRNVFLVVADGVPFPLNLPPDTPPELEEIRRRVSWPIPTHDDPSHPWPFAELDFAYKPRSLWPVSWLWPSMGLQKLLSWMYSFLASHIQVAVRQFMVVPEDIQEDLENKILHGGDFELLKIRRDHAGNFEQFLQFVKHPELVGDLWRVLQAVNHEWERSTGITELLHGAVQSQMRSAEEASVRSENTMLRPDDMADAVEDWQAVQARNEGIAWRVLGTPRDVAAVFGEFYDDVDPFAPQIGPYTGMWMQLLAGAPVNDILHEFDYRIAAGSARKPNRLKQRQDIDESAQILLPVLVQDYQQWGDPTNVNAWVRKWCETRDFDPGLIHFPDRRPQIMAAQMQQMGLAPPGDQAGVPPETPPSQGEVQQAQLTQGQAMPQDLTGMGAVEPQAMM